MGEEELVAKIQAMIDDGGIRTSVARDPVNRPMIHHLCDALGEKNPIHLDPQAAKAAGHPDVVAPTGALQVWNMTVPGEEDAAGPSPVDEAYDTLRYNGFPNVVAVNSEQEYVRYLVPGDLLTAEERVESISARKSTKLGPGHFITTLTTYSDQSGSPVGTMRFRTLWYAADGQESGDE
ncbi:MaoC family dehydratase N-terminal domain-containing protein [Tomitella fengzijianii]|uniref:MaoC family dehydratase n=1 Tax=Tomitella fengzijianii TaxID=2597660 RepID=A0A516X6Y3_9ACTN|nr:MaoC family dehydratase N-terminal domain-containing protein [Tomitella fengzijianii]QDQ98810.1 MaoC family dehydratase [Tomitella fengzijianii]